MNYHHQFLNQTLASTNPLRHSRIWQQLSNYSQHVHTGHGENKITGMQASGTSLSFNMLVLIKQLNDQTQQLRNEIKEMGDSLMTTMPETVVSRILEKVQVGGAIPITREDFNNGMSDIRATITAEIAAVIARMADTPLQAVHVQPGQPVAPDIEPNFQFFTWSNGTMMMIPEHWSLKDKKYNIKYLWERWWRGSIEGDSRIQGLRHLRSLHFPGRAREPERNYLTKVSKVMHELTNIVVSKNIQQRTLPTLDLNLFDQLFEQSFNDFCEKYNIKKRSYDMAIGTLRNYMKRAHINNDFKKKKKKIFTYIN